MPSKTDIDPRNFALIFLQRLGPNGVELLESAVRGTTPQAGIAGDQFVSAAMRCLLYSAYLPESCSFPWQVKCTIDNTGKKRYCVEDTIGSFLPDVVAEHGGLSFVDIARGYPFYCDRAKYIASRERAMTSFLGETKDLSALGREEASNPVDHSGLAVFQSSEALRYALNVLFTEVDRDQRDRLGWEDIAAFFAEVTTHGKLSFGGFEFSKYQCCFGRTMGIPQIQRFRSTSKYNAIPWNGITHAACAHHRNRLIVATEFKQICQLDSNSLELRSKLAYRPEYGHIVTMSYAKRMGSESVVAVSSADSRLRLFSEISGELVFSQLFGSPQTAMKYIHPMRSVICGSKSGIITACGMHSHCNYSTELFSSHNSYSMTDFTFIPVKNHLVASMTSGQLRIYDADTKAPLSSLHHAQGVHAMTYSEHFTLLATGGDGQTPFLWVPGDNRCIVTALRDSDVTHQNRIKYVHFVSNTPQFLSADVGGVIKLWDLRMMNCVQTIDHGEEIKHFEYFDDHQRFLIFDKNDVRKFSALRLEKEEDEEEENEKNKIDEVIGPGGAKIATKKGDSVQYLETVVVDVPYHLREQFKAAVKSGGDRQTLSAPGRRRRKSSVKILDIEGLGGLGVKSAESDSDEEKEPGAFTASKGMFAEPLDCSLIVCANSTSFSIYQDTGTVLHHCIVFEEEQFAAVHLEGESTAAALQRPQEAMNESLQSTMKGGLVGVTPFQKSRTTPTVTPPQFSLSVSNAAMVKTMITGTASDSTSAGTVASISALQIYFMTKQQLQQAPTGSFFKPVKPLLSRQISQETDDIISRGFGLQGAESGFMSFPPMLSSFASAAGSNYPQILQRVQHLPNFIGILTVIVGTSTGECRKYELDVLVDSSKSCSAQTASLSFMVGQVNSSSVQLPPPEWSRHSTASPRIHSLAVATLVQFEDDSFIQGSGDIGLASASSFRDHSLKMVGLRRRSSFSSKVASHVPTRAPSGEGASLLRRRSSIRLGRRTSGEWVVAETPQGTGISGDHSSLLQESRSAVEHHLAVVCGHVTYLLDPHTFDFKVIYREVPSYCAQLWETSDSTDGEDHRTSMYVYLGLVGNASLFLTLDRANPTKILSSKKFHNLPDNCPTVRCFPFLGYSSLFAADSSGGLHLYSYPVGTALPPNCITRTTPYHHHKNKFTPTCNGCFVSARNLLYVAAEQDIAVFDMVKLMRESFPYGWKKRFLNPTEIVTRCEGGLPKVELGDEAKTHEEAVKLVPPSPVLVHRFVVSADVKVKITTMQHLVARNCIAVAVSDGSLHFYSMWGQRISTVSNVMSYPTPQLAAEATQAFVTANKNSPGKRPKTFTDDVFAKSLLSMSDSSGIALTPELIVDVLHERIAQVVRVGAHNVNLPILTNEDVPEPWGPARAETVGSFLSDEEGPKYTASEIFKAASIRPGKSLWGSVRVARRASGGFQDSIKDSSFSEGKKRSSAIQQVENEVHAKLQVRNLGHGGIQITESKDDRSDRMDFGNSLADMLETLVVTDEDDLDIDLDAELTQDLFNAALSRVESFSEKRARIHGKMQLLARKRREMKEEEKILRDTNEILERIEKEKDPTYMSPMEPSIRDRLDLKVLDHKELRTQFATKLTLMAKIIQQNPHSASLESAVQRMLSEDQSGEGNTGQKKGNAFSPKSKGTLDASRASFSPDPKPTLFSSPLSKEQSLKEKANAVSVEESTTFDMNHTGSNRRWLMTVVGPDQQQSLQRWHVLRSSHRPASATTPLSAMARDASTFRVNSPSSNALNVSGTNLSKPSSRSISPLERQRSGTPSDSKKSPVPLESDDTAGKQETTFFLHSGPSATSLIDHFLDVETPTPATNTQRGVMGQNLHASAVSSIITDVLSNNPEKHHMIAPALSRRVYHQRKSAFFEDSDRWELQRLEIERSALAASLVPSAQNKLFGTRPNSASMGRIHSSCSQSRPLGYEEQYILQKEQSAQEREQMTSLDRQEKIVRANSVAQPLISTSYVQGKKKKPNSMLDNPVFQSKMLRSRLPKK